MLFHVFVAWPLPQCIVCSGRTTFIVHFLYSEPVCRFSSANAAARFAWFIGLVEPSPLELKPTQIGLAACIHRHCIADLVQLLTFFQETFVYSKGKTSFNLTHHTCNDWFYSISVQSTHFGSCVDSVMRFLARALFNSLDYFDLLQSCNGLLLIYLQFLNMSLMHMKKRLRMDSESLSSFVDLSPPPSECGDDVDTKIFSKVRLFLFILKLRWQRSWTFLTT